MTVGEPRSAKPPFEVTASRHFVDWLAATGATIGVTTYHSNRMFLIGVKPNGRLSVLNRLFERAMGLALSPERLLLSSRYQIFQFENVLREGEREGDYDRLYKPHLAWTTGDLDVHDLAFGAEGEPLFVNSLFACIATVDGRHSFRPLWRPPWISKLAPEDRCHLNGMALADGAPRYATAVAATDVAAGWREKRRDGGVVVDVASGEIVGRGRSMPHSPRLHGGRLWLLNSGTGELGTIDLADGRFEPVAFCPGYLRGLAFFGDFAIVGLSQCREERTFSGLELDERLAAKGVEARCGLAIVDLRTGATPHWLDFAGTVRELYDVQVLPGAACAGAYGLRSKEIWGVVTHEEDGRLVRHTGIPSD
jgi:uncharacterized protein (TIGR03032 family)